MLALILMLVSIAMLEFKYVFAGMASVWATL